MNSSFQQKQMVLVSRLNTDFYEVYDHHCTLLEIDDLKTTPFLLYAFQNRPSEILSVKEHSKLLNKKKLILEKIDWYQGRPSQEDTFVFSIIDVFVLGENVLVRQEDLFNKGILEKKTEARHIIRIKKIDNALATESKSSD